MEKLLAAAGVSTAPLPGRAMGNNLGLRKRRKHLLKGERTDMLDKYLIAHCAPTLASLKTANLFSLPFSFQADLAAQLSDWNEQLRDKGVTLTMLRQDGRTALIYVYRKTHLKADLEKPGVGRFLAGCGYGCTDADQAVEMLKSRFEAGGDFPHEIGLFLGYPLGDVIGFIRNAGRNSKCTGCWKVYCNACEARRLFAKFKNCRDVYACLWKQGISVRHLTVAA